ncbi:hypothetical protein BMS3Abin03_01638 [bacterium BMS3Abin03]|nr:hypothetical protein BMS3Abin03_01638 [bacterium BMS3Abin03]
MYFPVGIPALLIMCFAKVLCASISAAEELGPKTKIPTDLKAFASPSTKGCSGPITTRSTALSLQNSIADSFPDRSMFMFSAIAAVPGFPGNTNSFFRDLLSDIFHAKACSLPPDPTTTTFIILQP